jgi:hypothetical protein
MGWNNALLIIVINNKQSLKLLIIYINLISLYKKKD